jgi:tetratricopeptide (TPR) repeat protein
MYKIIKLFALILIVALVASCGKKEKEKDFNKLSNQEKILLLDAKIKKDPKNAELYYQRGEVFYKMENTKEALFNAEKAIELDKKQVKYYTFEADVLFARGEITLSFNALEEALKVDKKSTEAYLKIAELSMYMKDYDKSMDNIKKALEIDDMNPNAYYLRGYIMKETGDTARAVIDYKKAIELKSNYEQPFEELGLIYANRGDGLAVDYLNSTININPKNTNAMYALALFYQDHGAEQKALDMYKRILKIKPDYADAIHNVGYINYEYKHDYNTALDCFSKAIKADPTFTQAYFNRAKTYEKLNNKVSAKQDYQKVISLMPDNQEAKQALKRL